MHCHAPPMRGPALSRPFVGRPARPAGLSRAAHRKPRFCTVFAASASESNLIEKLINALSVTVTRSPLHEGKKRLFMARAGKYDAEATQQEIQQLLDQNERAKALLTELGARYKAVELDQVANGPALRAELIKMTDRTSVPNVFIRGKSVGGCNDGPGVVTLHKQGKLQPMLREAGALA